MEEKARRAREREERLADDVDAIRGELSELSKAVGGLSSRLAAGGGALRRQPSSAIDVTAAMAAMGAR